MDWIEEYLENLGTRIRNLNLRKSLRLYIFVAVLAICLASAMTIQTCNGWKRIIETPYGHKTSENVFNKDQNAVFTLEYFVPEKELTKMDVILLEIINLLQYGCVLLYSVLAIAFVSRLYYRNKLKKPITIMTDAAQHISRNDMGYSCRYDSADEMGQLCRCLDNMRLKIISYQENLWKQAEDQRTLNAALAHDLRTPLTVMQGYVDLLLRFYPDGRLPKEKVMEILKTMQEQLGRLKNFGGTMKEIHSMEERAPQLKKIPLSLLYDKTRETAAALEETGGMEIEVKLKGNPAAELLADEFFVLEVAENLLSNALRYADKKIEVLLEAEREEGPLRLYVKDDGRGFSKEELTKAVSPYYREKTEDDGQDSSHFGIGLSISALLCKKHGGELELANSIHGGAIVCAVFSCM